MPTLPHPTAALTRPSRRTGLARATGAALALALTSAATAALAAPVTYRIDPSHTYPSFEADHMGLSTWRGKFNTTEGRITLDREAGTGQVVISVDAASVDFGHNAMNAAARGSTLFDVEQHPYASYTGNLTAFRDGAPTRIDGQLTLRGVTRPLVLDILSLRCKPHPLLRREVCGADALGRFNRDDFGMDSGKSFGFDMAVTLRIQVEAIRAD